MISSRKKIVVGAPRCPEVSLESLTKILDFGVHTLPSMSTLTLSLGLKETEPPMAVNIIEKVELLSLAFLLQT